MRVATGGVACSTGDGDQLAATDLLAIADLDIRVVVIGRQESVPLNDTVADLDTPATSPNIPASHDHGARCCRVHGGTARGAEVNASVDVAARAVEVDGASRCLPPAETGGNGDIDGEGVLESERGGVTRCWRHVGRRHEAIATTATATVIVTCCGCGCCCLRTGNPFGFCLGSGRGSFTLFALNLRDFSGNGSLFALNFLELGLDLRLLSF